MSYAVIIILFTISYCTGTIWSNYSSVYCKRRQSAKSNICHFKNICWDRYSERFVFYHLSGLTAPFDGKRQYKLPSNFVTIKQGHWWTKEGTSSWMTWLPLYMNIAEVHSPIDFTHSVIAKDIKVAVFFESYWAENFAHALIDDILSSYSLLHYFNMYSRKAQLMTPKGKCDIMDRLSSSHKKRGEQFLEEMIGLISAKPILEMSKHRDFKKQRNPTSTRRFTCIPNVLVGQAELGLYFDKGYAWRSFKKSVFKHLKIIDQGINNVLNTPSTERKHLVVVIIKKGRRHVINTDYLVNNLQRMFDVEIVAVNPITLPFHRQIELALRATVIITPAGGISWFASFAAPKCAVIFFGQWSKTTNSSNHMEVFFWQQVDDILDYYYEPKLEEVRILPPGNASHPEEDDYQNYGSLIVNCNRFVKLVAKVLTISNNIHEIHAGEHFPFKNAPESGKWNYTCI